MRVSCLGRNSHSPPSTTLTNRCCSSLRCTLSLLSLSFSHSHCSLLALLHLTHTPLLLSPPPTHSLTNNYYYYYLSLPLESPLSVTILHSEPTLVFTLCVLRLFIVWSFSYLSSHARFFSPSFQFSLIHPSLSSVLHGSSHCSIP
ncbi:hypothetical protein L873DRAFT_1110543 [Choiromyces venosus 120613-1]|uniref:Uncharacterized protein n=1 Tax=Choiromyces venosus 120613-1 TaxID=1336337 RepID=A0A3N4JKL3_9PEZI|nr:hypothetical protein L873DRAFT_1110543 [Choiromyces venosus 120613-1]